MVTETYIGEEITQRKTKCRSCGEYLSKGEKRVAVEYDPYIYTTSKHTFMNYYHPKCWEEKKTTEKKGSSERKRSILPIIILVGIILFFISKILFLVTLFIFLVVGLAFALHKNS